MGIGPGCSRTDSDIAHRTCTVQQHDHVHADAHVHGHGQHMHCGRSATDIMIVVNDSCIVSASCHSIQLGKGIPRLWLWPMPIWIMVLSSSTIKTDGMVK